MAEKNNLPTAPPSDEMAAQMLLAQIVFDPFLHPDGCDIKACMQVLESYEMDEKEKSELIHTLWQLIQTVMQIRLGLDPVSEAQSAKEFDQRASPANMVSSDHKPETDFNAASSEGAPR